MKGDLFKGKFWLPDSKEHEVAGELEAVSDVEYRLTLFGTINGAKTIHEYFSNPYQSMQHDLIIGFLAKQECVAIIGTSFQGLTLNERYTYHIDVVLFTQDVVIESKEELVFNSVYFSFPDLHKYIGTCKIDKKIDMNHFSMAMDLERDTYTIPRKYTLGVNYGYAVSTSTWDTTELTPITSFFLKLLHKLSIGKVLELIDRNFSSIFSIIIGIYQCPIDLSADFMIGGDVKRFRIYYRYFNKTANFKANKQLCLRNMKDQLEILLTGFTQFTDQYPRVVENYFVLYRYSHTLEHAYLNAIYSLETFSRYVLQHHYYYDKAEFESKYKTPLMAHIEKEYREVSNEAFLIGLKNAIKYSNEMSLRAIVRSILNGHSRLIDQLFEYEVSKFTNKIVLTRNWYTHYNPEDENHAAKDYELHILLNKVRILFEVCLFKHIGMPDDTIITTLKSTYLIER